MKSLLLILLLAAGPAAADEIESLQKQLAISFPDVRTDQLAPSPIPGLYELRYGPQVAYVSADGRYIVRGDIIEIGSSRNLTDDRRNAARLAAIEEIGEANMVVFAPRRVKHTINVFTDIDCGYCRKLHREIDQYMELGVRVRYLFFPRSGPNTAAWTKAEQVWCSPDRKSALTRSKRGETLKTAVCASTPVHEHYALGLSFGVQGTPAIITDRGELLPGYLPAAELIGYLDDGATG